MDNDNESATVKEGHKPKKYLLIGLVIVVIVFVAFLAIGFDLLGSQPPVTGEFPGKGSQTKQSCPYECCINEPYYENRICQGSNYQCINNRCVKTNCPYECCSEGEFSAKLCPSDYECQNNKCKTIDSDKDGLTDIEERESGSNPLVYDTDADGLNDYAEKQRGTNPNNRNSDNDRYDDNADRNPTSTDSANINIQLTKGEWNWDFLGILNALKGDFNIRIAVIKADVSIQNNGNDYTDYARFDVVFRLITSEVKRVTESLGRLNMGETQNKHYEYDLKLSDIPNTLINAVQQHSTQWDVQLQNIQYERF